MSTGAKPPVSGWIKSIADLPVHTASGGIKYKQLSVETALAEAVEIDYVEVPKNEPIPDHVHRKAETVCLIVSGRGMLRRGWRDVEVKPGDTIYIPSGEKHGFSALTDDFAFVSIQHPPIGNDYDFH